MNERNITFDRQQQQQYVKKIFTHAKHTLSDLFLLELPLEWINLFQCFKKCNLPTSVNPFIRPCTHVLTHLHIHRTSHTKSIILLNTFTIQTFFQPSILSIIPLTHCILSPSFHLCFFLPLPPDSSYVIEEIYGVGCVCMLCVGVNR